MPPITGLWVWKVRSTPSPWEILRTVNEEFRPRFFMAMTRPSKACRRSRSPSFTLTCTITVSPGSNAGTFFNWASSTAWMILFMTAYLLENLSFVTVVADEVLKQLPLLRTQFQILQQVRASGPSPPQLLLQAPAGDGRMVTGEQHFRHAPALDLLGPR